MDSFLVHHNNIGNQKHGFKKPTESEAVSFFGIMPATVRYDKNLSSSEKVFYCEITALANVEGFCWATNKYFARLFRVRIETISRWLTKLTEKKYISIKRKGPKRCIYPNLNIINKKVLDSESYR